MKSPTDSTSPIHKGLAVDRDLVRRIVLSSAFAKSPRLSHFLRYICTEAEAGRQSKISEQSIGTAVFGRDPDYDSNADSIVRSHASRLRHRLREYFGTEGVEEPVVLTIPKGSYIPRFEPRNLSPTLPIEPEEVPHTLDTLHQPQPRASLPIEEPEFHPDHAASTRNPVLAWQISFAIAAVVAIACIAVLVMRTVETRNRTPHLFWSTFLDGRHGRTMLVESDSGLVMLQHFTRRPVSLASYISGEYTHYVSSLDATSDTVAHLGVRRYTPAVDSAIYEKIFRQLPYARDILDVRYARDLRLDDLKQGNAILLGTHESDPWVELFESSMNFRFHNDLAAGATSMVNMHPLTDEKAVYPMLSNDPEHTVYGLVAYRPNLTRTGHVLIVEGETMAGTQTASEFLLDDNHLLPFLKSIQKKDGTIPHFEVLIRSSSLAGESSQIDRVAYRVETD
jgi:hypothetical protein